MSETSQSSVDTSRASLFANQALGAAPARERLAALRDEPVLITLDRERAASRAGQTMLATAANILGRLFDFAPAIDIDAPASARVLPGLQGLRPGQPLARELAGFLCALSPDSRRYRYRPMAGAARYLATLAIGRAPLPAETEATIFIDAEAWTLCLSPEAVPVPPPATGSFNPFGPMVAGVVGAAEVAKHIFRRLSAPGRGNMFPPLTNVTSWNLWQHEFGEPAPGPPLPAVLELGRFALGGLGALGSAAVLALSQIEAAVGTVELVDDDTLSRSNLERVLIARGTDVGQYKVDVAARALQATRLHALPFVARYDSELPSGASADTIVVGVDSGAARRRIMNLLPAAIYNGGTQGSELLVSRHVGLAGACLECLYPEPDDPVGRIAHRFGLDWATAAALLNGERRVDQAVLAAMERRGGIRLDGIEANALLDQPLAALEAYTCSRQIIIEDLPEATISFVSGLCGFLMALELVKDRLSRGRTGALDWRRPVFRLDLLNASPGPACIEEYVARRDCFCRDPETRRRVAAAARA